MSRRPSILKRQLAGVLLVAGLLLAGCVTEVVEPETIAETRLIITRSGDVATVQWQSRTGLFYTVLYSGSRNPGSRWTPLPGAQDIAGDGTVKKFKDRIPYNAQRYYRIQAQPVNKKR